MARKERGRMDDGREGEGGRGGGMEMEGGGRERASEGGRDEMA